MADTGANLPAHRLRATTQMREAAQIAFNTAFDDGQLDFQEVRERSEIAVRATYCDELTALFQDLSFPRNLPATGDPEFIDTLVAAYEQGVTNLRDFLPADQSRRAPAFQLADPAQGDSVSVALFSGSTKRGPWICAPKHTVFCAFGGASIDLRKAQLTSSNTTIKVAANFGGIDVAIPENYRIVSQVLPIFGGSAVNESKRITISQSELPPDAPVIVVRGFAAFGGVNIRRVPAV